MDYLSPEILSVREVSKEDLKDPNEEEKFVLNEDFVVNIKRNNIVIGNVVNVSDRDVNPLMSAKRIETIRLSPSLSLEVLSSTLSILNRWSSNN